METTMNATAATATETTAAERSEKATTALKAFTVVSGIALTLIAARAIHGHPINTFMWIRAALLPLISIWLYRMTTRGSLARLRTLTLIMPIAIIGVDLIPGICPLWFAGLQTLCMIPVITARLTLPKTR